MKKKVIITLIVIIVIAALGVGGWLALKGRSENNSGEGPGIYVESIKEIMGLSNSMLGISQRYAGVVEPQKTVEIRLESERSVAEIYVSVDDEVKEGDPLFRYDNDALAMNLEQKKLELQKIDNSIEQQKDQIAELERQAQYAWGDTLLQYTLQIQEAQTELKQTEYDKQVKEMEIEKTEKQLNQSIVTSPITGIIRTINEDANNNNQGYGYNYDDPSNGAFMTIIVKGDFRIKGVINEQNVYMLMQGAAVTVRSRVDETQTWAGYIEEIDLNNPEQSNNNNYYYEPGDTMLQTSKYPFYITLESVDGLMMGQHVYIEVSDEYQWEPPHTEGVWLPEFYLMMEDDEAYVFVDKKGKIEKRKVTLGEYDEENMVYEITKGLTQDERIAWPDETVTEGAKVMN